MSPDQSLIVCLSGRGDKDVMQVKERFEAEAEGNKPWQKNINKTLQAIKDSKRVFSYLTSWRVTAKGLDGLFETIALLENSGVSAIEVGIPWSDPGPMVRYWTSRTT